jgi:hypothetical protein
MVKKELKMCLLVNENARVDISYKIMSLGGIFYRNCNQNDKENVLHAKHSSIIFEKQSFKKKTHTFS